ncbi:MAG: hypothetical protein OXI79_01410 [Gammaproteobacteria bacterium]|nr:hypothetical protein [Gammaproteobacteria bacterium]
MGDDANGQRPPRNSARVEPETLEVQAGRGTITITHPRLMTTYRATCKRRGCGWTDTARYSIGAAQASLDRHERTAHPDTA